MEYKTYQTDIARCRQYETRQGNRLYRGTRMDLEKKLDDWKTSTREYLEELRWN